MSESSGLYFDVRLFRWQDLEEEINTSVIRVTIRARDCKTLCLNTRYTEHLKGN